VPRFSLEANGFLAAPLDVVWNQLVDRESVSDWLDGIEQLSGSGARFATRRAAQPCSAPIEGKVLRLERERRLVLLLRAPWHLLREIELDIELAPEDRGTRVALCATHRLRPLGWLVRPLLRLRAQIALHRASRGFRAAIDDEMARRRRVLGQSPAGPRSGAPSRDPLGDPLLLGTILD
jgi:uncharacterized protein YndB with AHSA1/START domain